MNTWVSLDNPKCFSELNVLWIYYSIAPLCISLSFTFQSMCNYLSVIINVAIFNMWVFPMPLYEVIKLLSRLSLVLSDLFVFFFLSIPHRVIPVRVETNSRCGRNGPLMAQKSKLQNSWKRTLVQQCSSSNQKLYASCQSHSRPLSITRNHSLNPPQ